MLRILSEQAHKSIFVYFQHYILHVRIEIFKYNVITKHEYLIKQSQYKRNVYHK